MESTQALREQERLAGKDKRTRDILSAGLQLCLETGLADLDMKQVAAAAKVSRATLYRYFPSKKSLAYGMLRHFSQEMMGPAFEVNEPVEAVSGYDKFARFVEALLASYRQFPEFYRFVGAFDHYFGKQDDPQEVAQLYRDIFTGIFVEQPPYLFLEEGQRDGSVRQDIEADAYAAMAIESFVAFAQHTAVSGQIFNLLYDIEGADSLPEMLAQLHLQGAAREQATP